MEESQQVGGCIFDLTLQLTFFSTLIRYFNKFERYIDDPKYPDVDSGIKGSSGPVRIGYFSDLADSSRDFVQACTKADVPLKPDFNTTSGTRGVNRVSSLKLLVSWSNLASTR